MKQVVLITGSNGMLAQELAKQLEEEYTIRFLTRKKTQSNEYVWDINSNYMDADALKGVNCIIHLAGASIAEGGWTEERKKLILSSRVDSAKLILNELKKQNITIDTFISASAVGYYGSKTTNEVFEETSSNGDDFVGKVCAAWESAAEAFKTNNLAKRIVIVRIGVVLAKQNGALKKIMQPIKYGLGAAIGSGDQYMPWIHIHDLVSMFKFILHNNTMMGVYNAVSPQSITNKELTKSIAKAINKPILLPNIPKFIIKLLFGEKSTILLDGSRVSSKKITGAGFKFKFEKLSEALDDIFKE